jgi:F-type H+-transporting ATPase subunit b
MKKLTVALMLTASPALAAGDRFFSLGNTDFVVLLAFLLFIAVIVYFKVPGMIGGLLDKRADGIRKDLHDARALREEAQTLLASYERKQKEMLEHAERVVEAAKKEAEAAAVHARKDLEDSISRRMTAAQEQIAQAEAKAVKQVRDRAATVAVAAAGEVLRGQVTGDRASALIDSAIDEVGAKLH